MQQSSEDTVAADKTGDGGPKQPFAETMTTAPLIENMSKSIIDSKKEDVSPMPVERIQIKQGTNSASYLSQVPPPKVTTSTSNKPKLQSQVTYPFTMTVSQELKQNQSESATGALMIKGNKMQRDDPSSPKEINRV